MYIFVPGMAAPDSDRYQLAPFKMIAGTAAYDSTLLISVGSP
jgi:hypothetical protein